MNLRTALSLLVLGLPAAPALAQEQDTRMQRAAATERMLESRGDDALRAYAAEHLAPAYREAFADEEALLAHLRTLREAVAPIGGVGLMGDEETLRLHIKNRERESVVAMSFDPAPPHKLTDVVLESSRPRGPSVEVSWGSLEETLEQAVEKGFAGSVLAVRGGEVVLDRGFGHADPEKKHPVTPETLFAIGSTPIDFTHGAILKLEQMGRLSLDDSISKYFEDTPPDKAAITLEHLRSGRSGLFDFPGIEGVDANLDLSWIDRSEFLRRVLASQLLFEPGSEERHSHAAWGVLAAVVEVASGQSYEDFLREHFFEPAGMQHTGHYPLAQKFPASQVAVGLGGNVWGEVNSPAHWGETSWLVLGSGGMVSTPRDLWSWRLYLASGEVLNEAAQARYGIGGVFVGQGGNDRGFINTIGAAGDDLVIVCSNAHTKMEDFAAQIAVAAAQLVDR